MQLIYLNVFKEKGEKKKKKRFIIIYKSFAHFLIPSRYKVFVLETALLSPQIWGQNVLMFNYFTGLERCVHTPAATEQYRDDPSLNALCQLYKSFPWVNQLLQVYLVMLCMMRLKLHWGWELKSGGWCLSWWCKSLDRHHTMTPKGKVLESSTLKCKREALTTWGC